MGQKTNSMQQSLLPCHFLLVLICNSIKPVVINGSFPRELPKTGHLGQHCLQVQPPLACHGVCPEVAELWREVLLLLVPRYLDFFVFRRFNGSRRQKLPSAALEPKPSPYELAALPTGALKTCANVNAASATRPGRSKFSTSTSRYNDKAYKKALRYSCHTPRTIGTPVKL